MAYLLSSQQELHQGESEMRKIMKSSRTENPNSPFLTPQGAYMLQSAPLLALGALDAERRPWATVWGGESGFARQVESSIVGVRTLVDRKFDTVVEALF